MSEDRFNQLRRLVIEDSDNVTSDEIRELLALNAERERSAARAAERQRIYDEAAGRRSRAEAELRRGTERIQAALAAGAKE